MIARGRGPQRIVTKISITLKNLENNHKSRSMTDFLKLFKTTEHETRVEALKLRFNNDEVDRIMRNTQAPLIASEAHVCWPINRNSIIK